MENETPKTYFDRLFVRNMVESAIRIALLFALVSVSYDIVSPFVIPLLWGGIIAIAAFPLVKWLEGKIGGKRGPAAALVSLFFILLLVIPTFHLTKSLVSTGKTITAELEAGTLQVPPPPAKVANLPLIGKQVHDGWSQANENLEALLTDSAEEIKALLGKLMGALGGTLASMAMFVISLIIAGGFMAYAESSGAGAHRLFVRVGGEKPGGEWASLTVATVRSVLQGVVGVAVIQAVLCAIGLFVMGIPGAPIWSGIILFFAIAQLPAILIILPIVAWSFGHYETVPAVIFTVWMLLAGLSDNILKPMLMGRGLDIPMPVILIGAIGGMITSGIIGLFAGAVTLSIAYKLFGEWLAQDYQ